jgi:CO dehydrogenase/acetyl-CoA synthase epsilon subunit
MYELQRKKITQTTVVNVLLQSIRYRDPFLQVGKRVFGRETDVEISDFTGKINLHKIMTAKVAPNEIKSDIKREYKIARY